MKLADVRISFHSLEIEISFELQDLGSVSTCTSRLVDIFKVGVGDGSGVSVDCWDSVGYGVGVGVGSNTVPDSLWDGVSLGFSYILEFSIGVLHPIITRAIMIKKFS